MERVFNAGVQGISTGEPTRRDIFAFAALGLLAGTPGSALAATPEGQLTWGIHVSLAPVWLIRRTSPGSSRPLWCSMRCMTRW
jgi:hypothetical protein